MPRNVPFLWLKAAFACAMIGLSPYASNSFWQKVRANMNFVIGVGEGLAQLALAVISFQLLYRFTDRVAGWTQAEVLMLVGVYRIVEGLINLQIAPNMQAAAGYIRSGEMDFLLLRPRSSAQFLKSRIRLTWAGAPLLWGPPCRWVSR